MSKHAKDLNIPGFIFTRLHWNLEFDNSTACIKYVVLYSPPPSKPLSGVKMNLTCKQKCLSVVYFATINIRTRARKLS